MYWRKRDPQQARNAYIRHELTGMFAAAGRVCLLSVSTFCASRA